MRKPKSGLLGIMLIGGVVLGLSSTAFARSFRVSQIPNGNVFRCANCHVTEGGPRNSFGLDVFAIVGGSSSKAFWNQALAEKDSDGDGVSNGVELGDPDGDGQPTPGVTVTNPGDAKSVPKQNQPPVFSSNPVLEAIIGLPYTYQALAVDPEKEPLTYTKLAGPAWLSVATNGWVAGTPPDLSGGDMTVTIQVSDRGTPVKTTNQTYTLSVIASYAGWQAMHFTLSEEAALAAPLADPDGDQIPNLVEYGLRLRPKEVDVLPTQLPGFTANGAMTLSATIRDDDPKLEMVWEASENAFYLPAESRVGEVTDPVAGDGLQTLQYIDSVSRTNTAARFGRLTIRLLP